MGGFLLEAKWFSSSKSLKHCRMRNTKPKWSTKVRNTKWLELSLERSNRKAALLCCCEREKAREERGWGRREARERERENKGERQACALREQRTCLVRRTCKHERTNEFRSSSSPNASFHYCVDILIQQAYNWGGCMPIIVYIMWTSRPSFFWGVGGSVVGWLGNLQKSSLPPLPYTHQKKEK